MSARCPWCGVACYEDGGCPGYVNARFAAAAQVGDADSVQFYVALSRLVADQRSIATRCWLDELRTKLADVRAALHSRCSDLERDQAVGLAALLSLSDTALFGVEVADAPSGDVNAYAHDFAQSVMTRTRELRALLALDGSSDE